jgi:hypothetical protein
MTAQPTSTRELRIAIAIPMPAEAFAQAKAMLAAEPLLAHAQEQATKLGGTVMHELITPKPRKPNGQTHEDPATATLTEDVAAELAAQSEPGPTEPQTGLEELHASALVGGSRRHPRVGGAIAAE